MILKWPYLLAAVALLWPPAPFSATFQKSLMSLRRNAAASACGTTRVWQNWLDLARAGLGVYLLTQHAVLADSRVPGGEMEALVVQSSVVGLGLLVQTVRIFRTVQFLAPVFYLSGLTLVMGGDILTQDWTPGYLQGLFAVIVGWLFAIGGKNLNYLLPSMAVALAVAGYVLGLGLPLMVNCALLPVPFVVATLFRRPLVFAASSVSPA